MPSEQSSPKTSPLRLRPAERRTLLLAGDVAAVLLAWATAVYFWWAGDRLVFGFPGRAYIAELPLWFHLLPLFWLLLLVELYTPHKASRWRETVRGVVMAALAGGVIYLLVYFTSPPLSLPRKGVAVFFIAATVYTLIWRYFYIRVFNAPRFMRRVLVVGAGKAGRAILQAIHSIEPPPFKVVGVLDDDPQKWGNTFESEPVLGGSERLLEIVQREAVSDIIVAISGEMHGRMFQAILDAQERGVEIATMAAVYEELLERVPIKHLDADWLIRSFVDEARVSAFYLMGKRVVDIIGGLIGVTLLAVLFPWIALAIVLESGFPVFFKQTRSGRGGRPFTMIKFRTMRPAPPGEDEGKWADDDAHRITALGAFLRKTHLDEFPQFINVLAGDMSVVGPRPEQPALIADLEQKIPFYRARLLVKPGVTGWAQVNYGYVASVHDTEIKLEYDLYYIKHRSLLFDVVIILRTLGTIFGGKGR